MLEGRAFECTAGEAGDYVGLRCWLCVIFSAHQIAVGDDGREQSFGDDVRTVSGFEGDVFELGLKATACDAGRVQGVVVQMMV